MDKNSPLEVILHLDGTGRWPEIEEQKLEIVGISRLPRGMTSGRSSVAVIIVGPDGKKYAAETSMRIFLTASQAFKDAEETDTGRDGGWHD